MRIILSESDSEEEEILDMNMSYFPSSEERLLLTTHYGIYSSTSMKQDLRGAGGGITSGKA